MKRIKLAVAGVMAAAAVTASAAIPASAAPARLSAVTAPAANFRPGSIYFQGRICLPDHDRRAASDLCWRAQAVKFHGAKLYTLFMSISNPKKVGGTLFRVINVGTPHGTWPFRYPSYNAHFATWRVVNFELMLKGKPTGQCVQDGPFGQNHAMFLGNCSPIGQDSRDKWWSHLVWQAADRIIEPNLTNASPDHKVASCVTAVFDPGRAKQYAWSPYNVDSCFSTTLTRVNHWWARR